MKIRFFMVCLVGCVTILLGILQLLRPSLKNPPYQPLLEGATVPHDLANLFERSCQDCHSNNTHWPWYARVMPVSMLVSQDVNKGRAFLNLSEWKTYRKGAKLGYLSSMAEATRNHAMPPRLYRTLHPHARLTDADRTKIAMWASEERRRLQSLP